VLPLLLAAAVLLGETDLLRTPRVLAGLETNEAMVCLTNILREQSDWTFTICSANDELRMVEDYGYHYEPITLLRQLEDPEEPVTIPTEYVYFFVEKVPLDYYGTSWGSGQTISTAGAAQALPEDTGLSVYYTENRWVVMSRLYQWAEAFREKFPYDMEIYYETENFCCYRLRQNVQQLLDLNIDYGYNRTP
jgi:hypothetical protein